MKRSNRFRYLRYWWDRRSQIDPETFSGKHYRVFYDRWRRYVLVETYDPNHELIAKAEFVWKGLLLQRSISYAANGNVKFYTLYQYTWYGWPLNVERHFPDGTSSVIPFE